MALIARAERIAGPGGVGSIGRGGSLAGWRRPQLGRARASTLGLMPRGEWNSGLRVGLCWPGRRQGRA